MGDGKIVYEICKAYGWVVRTIRVGSCYDIEHGGVCRGLIEYQELDSDSREALAAVRSARARTGR
jgi:hypothetical protein